MDEPAPRDDDDLLEVQLAYLDRIEQRQEQLVGAEGEAAGAPADASTAAVMSAAAGGFAALLDGAPEPGLELPPPEAGFAAYRAWLDAACARLAERTTHNHDELARLSSQWLHISRNLTRFRPDEVATLVESQARVRERLAADEAMADLLARAGAHLRAWEASRPALLAQAGEAEVELTGEAAGPAEGGPADTSPAPAADVELVRRLLDEGSADRARSARAMLEPVLETLCGVVLDMEVVQRQVAREPHASAEVFRGLQDRLTAVVDDLRTLPDTDVVEPQPDEPLHATLRRCVDRHRGRLVAEFAWSGGEAASDEVRRAATWVVEEFLSTAGRAAAGHAGVALGADSATLLLRLTAPVPLAEDEAGVEPGWVLRCRARAAVAGGTLAVDRTPSSCALDLRFPLAPPPSYATSGSEPPERG